MEVRQRGELVANIPDYQIKPSDLKTPHHYWGAFDNAETEFSARYVVRLSQRLGDWAPFNREQIEGLYN